MMVMVYLWDVSLDPRGLVCQDDNAGSHLQSFFVGNLSKANNCWCQNLRIFPAYPPAPCPSPAPWPWPVALFWTCSPWSSRWGSLSTHSQSGAGAWNCRRLNDEDEKWKTHTLSGKGTNREAWSYHTCNFCITVRNLLAEAFLHSDALGPEELCTVYDQPGNIIMVIPAKIISD